KSNLSRLHYCYPAFESTFTRTHSNCERRSSVWIVRENSNQNFSTTLHLTSHRNTNSSNFATCNPRCFSSLQTIISKADISAAFGSSFHTSTVLSTILNTFWH